MLAELALSSGENYRKYNQAKKPFVRQCSNGKFKVVGLPKNNLPLEFPTFLMFSRFDSLMAAMLMLKSYGLLED